MLILRFSNLISLYKNQRKLSLKLEKSMILTDPILRSLFKDRAQIDIYRKFEKYAIWNHEKSKISILELVNIVDVGSLPDAIMLF